MLSELLTSGGKDRNPLSREGKTLPLPDRGRFLLDIEPLISCAPSPGAALREVTMDRKDRAVELLTELSGAHGAPGCENEVRRIVRRYFPTAHTDPMGNIFVEKEGSASTPRILLTAHMDEVGLMVQAVLRSGLIKFVPLGGWWAHTLLAQRMRIRTGDGRELPGVIGAKPPHFLSESERDKVVKIEDMFLDVGARDDEEVRRLGIRIGDPIVPDTSLTLMGNPDFLLSKAFDNRCGMALMIQVLEELRQVPHPNTLWAAGTVQEEVGVRGARTAVYGINPDAAIVLEGCPADDLPGTPEDERQGALGKGVQIRRMDPSAMMNRAFVDYALETARSRDIPHQEAVRRSGGTDARAVHLHGRGVPTLVLGVPARYIHTQHSIVCVQDYLSALQLALELIGRLDEDRVCRFTQFDD